MLDTGTDTQYMAFDDDDKLYDDTAIYGSLHSDPDYVVADAYVVPDALPFSTTGGVGVQNQDDVMRSAMPTSGGTGRDWRSGATALVGHSNQEFVAADYFEVDKTKKVEIKLRLKWWD